AVMVYGVTSDDTLFSFDSSSPGTLLSGLAISGFSAAGEHIRGIDFRPATGELFASGSFGQLYTVNTSTAALTAVGNAPIAINGTAFGFDFNPAIDRIRLVSNPDHNYFINPNDGTISSATSLAFHVADPLVGLNPNVVGSAYTNSVGGV